MSYILDALRKSDQQRQRGAPPTLLTLQPSAVIRKRPAYLAYGLFAVVLIGVGVAIGWLRPWQTEQAAPARTASVAAGSSDSQSFESTSRPPTPAQSEMAAQPRPELSAAAKPQTDGLPPEANAPLPGIAVAPPTHRVDIAAADAAGETVIAMEKLPLSIQQEIPRISISVHVYSRTPAKRLIGIGSRMLREGDYLIPGLQLEEITMDGMILSYKGYRFRRGVK